MVLDVEVNIQNISKRFKKQTVLDLVTLTMESGQIHCLLGASGAGKTTLLRILTGALLADSGTVKMGDVVIPNRKFMKKIGFMPQEDGLYHELSIYDNLRFFGGIQGIHGQEFRDRAKELLDMIQLENEKNKLIANCSGGMKKRVSLAVSMIHSPDILLLDEPTVGIDPVLRCQIWEYLQAFKNQGKTIIVTTHVMDEIKNCDFAALLRDGHVIVKDTIPNLLKRSPDGNIETLFFEKTQKGRERTC